MLDIDKTIEDIEGFFKHLGYIPDHIKDATQMLKMWRQFKEDSCEFQLIKVTEEEFFPTIIYQTLKVAVQGDSGTDLRRIKDTIECIKGVNEVRL